MATTVSEQRRDEIVRELRYISGHPPEWATSASVMAEFLDADYPVKWRDSGELFSMLADLVERTTCRNLAMRPADEFLCSSCGEHVDIAYMDSTDDYHASYCPHCGSAVVR